MRDGQRVSAAGKPAAIIVDGSQNALSVARGLTRRGVKVYALCDDREPVRVARGVTRIPMPDSGSPASWERFLLGPESDYLSGSVLLACSDPAIKLIARNSAALSKKFLIEESEPDTRLLLLDKLRTYEKSVEAGIPTVAYAMVDSFVHLQKVADTFRFPVILKPLYSPDAARLGGKFVMAKDRSELLDLYRRVDRGVRAVAMEFIPGGDDLLCSYYTYMDKNSVPLIEFTKRLLRRGPTHTGSASYHITDWNPEVAELGRKFFQHMKLKGIGNIEFKRDLRDGQLKIIEANARFTLGDPLLAAAGVDLAAITYARLTKQPLPARRPYKRGLVLWLPAEDVRALFQLRAAGKITYLAWFASVLRARVFPYFSWRDPMPSIDLNIQRALLATRMIRDALRGRFAFQWSRGLRKGTTP